MNRMKTSTNRRRLTPWIVIFSVGVLLPSARASAGQAAPPAAPGSHPTHQTAATSTSDQELLKQIAELRAQVARLQTLVEQQNPTSPKAKSGMGGKPQAGMMDMMMGMDKAEMAGMSGGGMAGAGMAAGATPTGGSTMKMDKGEMGMAPPEMMMEMGGMGSQSKSGGMQMAGSTSSPATSSSPISVSALPGVPGGSHLYHIGSNGFFLDQVQLKLTTDQQVKLNQIKERALLARTTFERQIEQAEQDVWALTGAGQPDAVKIQAKLQEVERLRTSQRLAFITAVGDATAVLTPEQRDLILGIKK